MNAAITDLLAECDARGIVLSLAGDDGLTIDAPSNAMTPELVERLREHKAALLALLRTPEGLPFPPEMIYCQHNWIDTAESDGRTRRFCSTCGRFGGFVHADGTVTEQLPLLAEN